jgi:hypothetical protein
VQDFGNETLSQYAVLLIPLWDKNPAVVQLLQQLLTSNDRELKYKTMLLFIRNGKPFPDSIINYFASGNDYRYKLYNDLTEINRSPVFPVQFKNHLHLAASKLSDLSEYNKPDTISFLARKLLQWKGSEGYIYFFKYKRKKDDAWKLASVGLIQKDSTRFEFKNARGKVYDEFEFTEFSNVKLDEDETLDEQLEKRMKQLVYAKRPSAKEFYKTENEGEGLGFKSLSK